MSERPFYVLALRMAAAVAIALGEPLLRLSVHLTSKAGAAAMPAEMPESAKAYLAEQYGIDR